jgi:hypothetical protein
MKNNLVVCILAKNCKGEYCGHKLPHIENSYCEANFCAFNAEFVECIPYKEMKTEKVICNNNKGCILKCFHKKPHLENEFCLPRFCSMIDTEKVKCIKYNPPKRKVRYTLKQLHSLWIEWVNKYDINCQKFFQDNGLPGSFVMWLNEREKLNGKI